MISIIYSTRTENKKFKEYLIKTSGLKNVDVVEVVNNGEFSLTQSYNLGIKKSKYDNVILCHDDILLPTGFGRKILKHFELTDYGILGVAGTTDLDESGQWWKKTEKMVGIVKHSHNGKTWENKYSQSFNEIINVCCIDGLFMCFNKDRVKHNFDESIPNFHFYDISWSFKNHLDGVKVGVIFDVRVIHKSIGMTNDKWESNRQLFIEKFKENLPHNIKPDINFKKLNVTIKKEPKLSIVIPTKGNTNLLFNCINSILEKDSYQNLKIYIADTGSTDDEITQIKEFIKKDNRIILIEYNYYNFASINNHVINNHIDKDTELILFCNNDIELLNNSISRMVEVYINNKKTVGTIGCRLHFGDNTIQHSGVIVYLSQNQQTNKYNINLNHQGIKSYYNYHNDIKKDMFGNTAAFMMISKELFTTIGGFSESYNECFEDVELNIDCINQNKTNIFVGDAVCYHLESQTRNKSEGKLQREVEDYGKIISKIVTNKKTYNYFENIKGSELDKILNP